MNITQKTFFSIIGILFLLLTDLHAARLVFGWEAVSGGWQIPMWVSWIAIVLTGFLSFKSWKIMKK
jgi:phosphoglycerol transferase MdoB-like AlkP superfamily enzyme